MPRDWCAADSVLRGAGRRELLAVEREAEVSGDGSRWGHIDDDQTPCRAALGSAAPSFIRNSLRVSLMFAICFNRDQTIFELAPAHGAFLVDAGAALRKD